MHIVIIDNDAALLRSLRLQLEFEGHSVMPFTDPRQALFYIVRGNPADVVLVDYSMPEMNGDEVIERLRPELPEGCHVVMMSAHTDLSTHVDAQRLGIDALLQKPISRSALKHAIHEYAPACNGHGEHQE